MAKRFVDTELWQKEWFQDLSIENKLLLKYIFENCDCAGVWNSNLRLASFILGYPYTIDDIHRINKKKEQFEILDNGNIFVIDFIKFQYGTLSENCKPHKPVIEKLKKYGLFERVSKGYRKGLETLEEKEQEQYKEKEQEKERKLFGTYLNVSLDIEQYQSLLALCLSEKLLNELINSFSCNIEVGKERPYTADLPNAHFERLKSYYNYRKKNPNKFVSETAKQDVWDRLAEKIGDI
jgi:hypothetical protein